MPGSFQRRLLYSEVNILHFEESLMLRVPFVSVVVLIAGKIQKTSRLSTTFQRQNHWHGRLLSD